MYILGRFVVNYPFGIFFDSPNVGDLFVVEIAAIESSKRRDPSEE